MALVGFAPLPLGNSVETPRSSIGELFDAAIRPEFSRPPRSRR